MRVPHSCAPKAEIALSCSHKFRVATLLLLAFGASLDVCAQVPGVIWRNDFTAQLTPSFGPYYGGGYSSYQQRDPFTFSSDGELLMRTPSFSGTDDEITRFTADGAVRWHVNLGSTYSASEPGYGAMLGYADGSAIVWAQAGGAVVKIGANGSLQWSQLIYADLMAPLGSQAVAVLSCNKVYALDAQSGQVLWTLVLTPSTGNCSSSLTSDAAGNGYVSTFNYNYNSNTSVVQLLKFSPGGQVLWQRSDAASSNFPTLLGVGATLVYEATPVGVQAYAAADGTPAWTAPGARGLTMAGTPAEPIVVVGSDVQRLAESDGQPRWHQTLGSAQYASGSATRVLVENKALDAVSGAPLWQAALPPANQDGSNLTYINSGFLSDGSAMFGGYAYGTSGRPFLVRADGASGQLLGSPLILPSSQSPLSSSVRVDPNTIARAAATVTLDGADLRVRAVDADSGATRWNALEPLDFYAGLNQAIGVAGGGSVIAVTMAGEGGGWVGAFDKTYGFKQWHKQLYLNFNGGYQGFAVADPLVDASGNVFVSYGAPILCPFPLSMNYSICKQLTVLKVGPDGTTVWQRDDVFGYFSGGQIFAGSITLAGNDVVVNSDFTAPYGADSLLKLSGADGSVLWGSPIYRQNGNQVSGVFVEPDDGNLIVTGTGWSKLDSATGAVLWSNACEQFCFSYDALVLDDGSLLSAAQDQQRMLLMYLPATAGATAVTWRPDQADTRATTSLAMTPFRDSSGNVWLRTVKRYGKSDGVFYLSRFDMQSGTLASQQAMTIYGKDPLTSYLSPFLLAAPEGGRLPVWFDANQTPAPFTWGDAMLDSSITATGNLGVQVFSDHPFAVPGDVITFHVVASYNGSAAITGARVLFDFSWPGHATSLVCAKQAASNCVIDARGGAMTATFDIQSGGHVDISGQLRVGASSNPQLHALIAGPIGLDELDTSDNGMSLLIDQSIFKNGFE